MTLLVFEAFHVNFYSVTDFEIGVVAEFAYGDDTIALRTDAHHNFTLGDVSNFTFSNFVLVNVVESLVVGSNESFLSFASYATVFKCVPVEIGQRSNVFEILH